jgi:hypothetical protein
MTVMMAGLDLNWKGLPVPQSLHVADPLTSIGTKRSTQPLGGNVVCVENPRRHRASLLRKAKRDIRGSRVGCLGRGISRDLESLLQARADAEGRGPALPLPARRPLERTPAKGFLCTRPNGAEINANRGKRIRIELHFRRRSLPDDSPHVLTSTRDVQPEFPQRAPRLIVARHQRQEDMLGADEIVPKFDRLGLGCREKLPDDRRDAHRDGLSSAPTSADHDRRPGA